MKILRQACVAMAAFAAIFLLPSFAQGVTLTHPTGTATIVGTRILATSVAHAGTAKTVLFKTGIGNIECETATLTGEVSKNSGGVVEANIWTVEFFGTSGASDHIIGEHCNGGFGGNTTVTPNHSINALHNGIVSLPWCFKAGAETTFTIRGGNCPEPSRPLTFTLHTSTIGSCSYQKAQVNGTFTAHPADLIGTIQNQSFTMTTGGVFCPKTGEFFAAFTFTTDLNGAHGTQIYLDH